jgi:catechol 2,3-dioxygenase-like lactoylglutathione lyase family enzyme
MLLGSGLAAGVTLTAGCEFAQTQPTQAKDNGNPILGARGGLHHAAIRTSEWDRTLDFYQTVLGFAVKMIWGPTRSRGAYLDSGDGTCLEVFEDPAFIPAPTKLPFKSLKDLPAAAIVHICLRTTRLDAAFDHARAHGARVIMEPVDYALPTITGQGPVPVRFCFLEGPSGEWIELLENAP